ADERCGGRVQTSVGAAHDLCVRMFGLVTSRDAIRAGEDVPTDTLRPRGLEHVDAPLAVEQDVVPLELRAGPGSEVDDGLDSVEHPGERVGTHDVRMEDARIVDEAVIEIG